ncbi:MAG: cobalt-precorrin-6A reductase [Hyphomicrobiales bacterium]|nr:cobalt-precorrin-6A reductase [Hyphomicrobiales bacterium]
MTIRVLILGGSSEASALVRLVAERGDIEATLSLAGRTAHPSAAPIPTRSGGFGGVEGLVDYLRYHRTEAVIDATHPFALQMSRHAEEACARLALPLVALTRAAWKPVAGDRWLEVGHAADAVAILGEVPSRVFLTVGRLSLPAFAAAPFHHYLIRAIDPPDGLEALPNHELILARPPFSIEGEERLMREKAIEFLVSKNSGGEATYAKIAAARRLGLPVVMIRRPKQARTTTLDDPAQALAWIERHGRAPSPRGV